MNKKIINVLAGCGIGIGGMIFGSMLQSYRNLKNTPEATIAKLEAAKDESRRAKEEAIRAKEANENALSELRLTEQQYKSDVRKELEPKIRKELETYISKADETYEKAKQERTIAEAKLELMKYIEKNSGYNESLFNTIGGATIWSAK